ncbi:MAG: PAS-domain containing protein [Rhodocyclales bacterium]|nr:PAS-domain containing protein [Rhodocyclales bacterium]
MTADNGNDLRARQLELIQCVGRTGYWEYHPAEQGQIILPVASQRLLCSILDCADDSYPTFIEILEPKELKRLTAAFEKALAEQQAFAIVLELQRGNTVAYLQLRGAPFESDGTPTRLAGTFHDITSEKRNEEQLTRQRDEMRTILDNFPGAISLCGPDLRMTAFNHQIMELLDFPPSLFDKGWVDFADLARFNAMRGEYGAGDPDEQVRAIVERAHNFQAHQIERLRPNGRWLEIRGTPIPSGGFVTSYVDITERKHIEAELVRAKEIAEAQREQLANLLDNSGQGFLSFGADMVVDAECSRACEAMLGGSPAGRHAAEVLFGEQQTHADLLRATIPLVVAESDPWICATMLSLLPGEFPRHERLFKAEYKRLENRRVMVILTDVTEQRLLEAKVEAERRRLEMIVSAVTDSRDFFDTVDAFREFITDGLPTLLNGPPSLRSRLVELYREVHTFKGLMNQFSFTHTPTALHVLESHLDAMRQHDAVPSSQQVEEIVRAVPLRALLDADLRVLREALGPDFVENGDRIVLSANQAEQLQQLAEKLLRGEPIDATTASMRRLLTEMEALHRVSFADALRNFDRVIRQTAARLEKIVAPLAVRVEGNAWIDTRVFRPFLRSLTHVFRNAVVHGIEDPDTRLEAGKDECGVITCTVTVDEGADTMTLTIADDGAGIDVTTLCERAAEAAILPANQITSLTQERILDLIFRDHFGTSTETTDLAGRGMGLAAVRNEVRKLGGDVVVESSPGDGSCFIFTLPYHVDVTLKTEASCRKSS